jgi:predicted short-subunit dehydrogenase-like oxidoreductase (DUF2520 family)
MLITLIGAGNLATQLGLAFHEKGHPYCQVYSRTVASAEKLATTLEAEPVTDPEKIRPGADLYICALKDDAIQDVLSRVRVGKALMVHTAGSLPMELMAGYSSNYGVFYPLQTFSKLRKIEFRNIPIFVEASNPESRQLLYDLASEISGTVCVLDSEKRKYLHVSAVFASNFVNHLYAISDDILREKGLDFSYLLPLIEETTGKVHAMSALDAQTGPAVRFDKGVMENHVSLLKGHPEWIELYEKLSRDIHRMAINPTKTNNPFL